MNLEVDLLLMVQKGLFSEEDFKIWSSFVHCGYFMLLLPQFQKEGTDYLF